MIRSISVLRLIQQQSLFLRVSAIAVLAMCMTASATASWVRVTCQSSYKYSETDSVLSCSESDLLEDHNGTFIPGFSRARVDLDSNQLFISSGGGIIRDVGFNGGHATAYFRKRYAVEADWSGWVAVTIKLEIDFSFSGYGESQIKTNLRTYTPGSFENTHTTSVILHHDGFQQIRLLYPFEAPLPDKNRQSVHLENNSLKIVTTQLLHHSMPGLDVRVDLLSWSLPHLEDFGSSVSAFAEANARIALMIPGRTTLDLR